MISKSLKACGVVFGSFLATSIVCFASSPILIPPPPHMAGSPILIPPPPHMAASPILIPPPPHMAGSPILIPPPPHVASSPILIPPPPHMAASPILIPPPPHMAGSPILIPPPPHRGQFADPDSAATACGWLSDSRFCVEDYLGETQAYYFLPGKPDTGRLISFFCH